MENITPGEIWSYILAVASALVLLANAADKIILAIKTVKAPENKQNAEIKQLKTDVAEIKAKLEKDKQRLDDSANANHITQEALLALLEHGLNGNNIDQMNKAKDKLQNYLINH